jgi:hypothetical protein
VGVEEVMRVKGPNRRLAEAMSEAGMSNKALARAVREVSGGTVNCDHTSVGRWLRGNGARPETAQHIADALGRRLGRTIAPTDIGFAASDSVDPTVGTSYADTATGAVDALEKLWRADLDGAQALTGAPANSSAWAEAPLTWLVRPDQEPIAGRPAGARVGRSDVVAVRGAAGAFAALDDRFGGGHARTALIQYLNTDVARLLNGQYTETVGRSLYSASAEATLLAAWMSYDAGFHGLAQRYFIQALRLAHAGNDVLLAGSILDAMSHQATFLGRHREATNLARAARTGTRGHATPTLTAHFHAMEARALACGGDVTGAHRSLSEAVRVFERRQPGNDPVWISYFDDGELAAEFSHCFRDIKRTADAVTYAERSLAGASGSPRSNFFVTMVLAAGHLGQGDTEQACQAVRTALTLGAEVRSSRCVEYLRQFRQRLVKHARSTAVRTLADEAAEHPLWMASEP